MAHWAESGTHTIQLPCMEEMECLSPFARQGAACKVGEEGTAREVTAQWESSGHLSLAGFVLDFWFGLGQREGLL